MAEFVAIVQQGMVLDQKVIATGDDESALRQRAEAEAQRLDNQQTGFGEGWTAVVLPVKS